MEGVYPRAYFMVSLTLPKRRDQKTNTINKVADVHLRQRVKHGTDLDVHDISPSAANHFLRIHLACGAIFNLALATIKSNRNSAFRQLQIWHQIQI